MIDAVHTTPIMHLVKQHTHVFVANEAIFYDKRVASSKQTEKFTSASQFSGIFQPLHTHLSKKKRTIRKTVLRHPLSPRSRVRRCGGNVYQARTIRMPTRSINPRRDQKAWKTLKQWIFMSQNALSARNSNWWTNLTNILAIFSKNGSQFAKSKHVQK